MTVIRYRKDDLQRLAEEAFASFNGSRVVIDGNRFRAPVGRVDVTLWFARERADYSTLLHAACSAPITVGESDVVLAVRPAKDTEGAVGSSNFDRMFDVEIAPARIKSSVFDRRSRTRLMALHPCTLTLEERVLTLEVRHGLLTHVKLRKMLRTVAAIAEALPREIAARELHGVDPTPEDDANDDGSAYRGPSPEKTRAAAERREEIAADADRAEVRTVLRERRTRDFHRALKSLALLLVFLGGLVWLLVVCGGPRAK